MKYFVPLPRSDRAEKSLSGGSSDSLGRGMDLALTLGAFLVIGILLDRWLGTAPLFTIALIVVSAIGQFVHMKYAYDREMDRLESERRSARAAKHAGGSARPASMEDAA